MFKTELLYKIDNDKILALDDLANWKQVDVNKAILDKFLQKYEGILQKQPLGLCNINNIYFLYPYSLGYGYPKTNIAKLIQIAKTGDINYCKKVFNLIKDDIYNFAKNYNHVVFVPYSVERNCNILSLLKDYLKEKGIKIIKSEKVKPGNEIKNIKSLKEKFKVASEKFDIDRNHKFKSNDKILIIDDMINTGASMCAIANKLPSNLKIDGLSIVGSLTNDIISDI